MAIPGTEALSLCAPHEVLPGLTEEGHVWYAAFEPSTGEPLPPGDPRRAATLDTSRQALHGLFSKLTELGYPPRSLFLLGYGQGGVAALDAALSYQSQLGGVVAVSSGAFLPEFAGAQDDVAAEVAAAAVAERRCWTQSATPILLTHADFGADASGGDDASGSGWVPWAEAKARHAAVAAWGKQVQRKRYAGAGPQLLSTEEQVRDFYGFLAPLLISSLEAIAQDGNLVEVAGGNVEHLGTADALARQMGAASGEPLS